MSIDNKLQNILQTLSVYNSCTVGEGSSTEDDDVIIIRKDIRNLIGHCLERYYHHSLLSEDKNYYTAEACRLEAASDLLEIALDLGRISSYATDWVSENRPPKGTGASDV